MAAHMFQPSQEQRKVVEMAAALGIPHEDIRLVVLQANGHPITAKTLAKHFVAELATGLTKATVKVGGALFNNAVVHNNVAAQIFWLKTRARWKESMDVNVTHVLTPEVIAAINWSEFNDVDLAAVEAGKLSNELIARLLASARTATA